MHVAYLHYLGADDTAMNHVRQFSEAARALGHRVDVHAVEAGSGANGAGGVAHAPPARRRPLGRYLHEPKEVLRNVIYARREPSLLAGASPDVLLVRDDTFTVSWIATARRLGLPVVLEVNAPAIEARLYRPEYVHLPLVPSWLEAWKLRTARAVTVVSSGLAAYFRKEYDVPAAKLTVVPNGADVVRFRPDTPPDPEVHAWARGRPVVGFVGSFQAFHGAGLLAEMIQDVARLRGDVCFVLVGDGPEAGPLRAATAALDDRVRFTGRVPHARVPALVATFDVGVVVDGNFYMSPLKVVEWMAAGRAVVAPRYEPLLDLVRDGVDGVLFEPRRREALVSAVSGLVADAPRRAALGAAAAAHVRAGLTWEHNAARVLGACKTALAGPG